MLAASRRRTWGGNWRSQIQGAGADAFYDVAADGRMSALRTDTRPARSDFLYDDRGFLREAHLTAIGQPSDSPPHDAGVQ